MKLLVYKLYSDNQNPFTLRLYQTENMISHCIMRLFRRKYKAGPKVLFAHDQEIVIAVVQVSPC